MAGQRSDENSNISAGEGEEFENAFKTAGITGVMKYAKEKLNKWQHIGLDIAVTGQSGAGKSSYINAIRGLKSDGKGAAYTVVKEATSEIKPYDHPSNKNIVFWDLPGVGTDNFQRTEYVEKVNLPKYDFFIIISSERFSADDGWLADEIKRMDKRFYFVRSNVDNDIHSDSKSRGKARSEEEILEVIRSNCQQNLERHGISDSPVYLIDNLDTQKFDFGELQAKLIGDAPQLQREAMVFSIAGRAECIIIQKKEELEKRIPKLALTSAVAGAVPIPGVGAVVYIAILIEETMFYRKQFGLTDDDLKSVQIC